MAHRKLTATVCAMLALGLAALAGLVGAQTAQGVAKGETVAEGQYEFATKLTFTGIPRTDGTHYDSGCSAALVAPEWIVTAAHCFHDAAGKPVSGVVGPGEAVPYASATAVLGRVDVASDSGHELAVVEVVQAPRNDVALARLEEPVDDIDPLRLPDSPPEVGDVVRITGWGAVSSVDPVPSPLLQTGQMKITSITDAVVGVVGYAPAPDTSACRYDSGAPYFTEAESAAPVLVSVESDGPRCPHSQVETTARVDVLTDWIRDVVHREGAVDESGNAGGNDDGNGQG